MPAVSQTSGAQGSWGKRWKRRLESSWGWGVDGLGSYMNLDFYSERNRGHWMV